MEIYSIASKKRGAFHTRQMALILYCLGVSIGILGISVEMLLDPSFYWLITDPFPVLVLIVAFSLSTAVCFFLLAYMMHIIGFRSLWMKLTIFVSISTGVAVGVFPFFFAEFLIISHVFLPAIFSIIFAQAMKKSMDFWLLSVALMLVAVFTFIMLEQGALGLVPMGVILVLSGRKLRKTIAKPKET